MLDLPPQHIDTAAVHEEFVMAKAKNEESFVFLVDSRGLSDTGQNILAYAEKVHARFADGLQWGDIPATIEYTLELVSHIFDISSKRDFVIKIVDKVIDITDTPFLPDGLTDPIFKSLASALINFTFNLFDGKASFDAPSLWDMGMSDELPSKEDLKRVAYRMQDVFKDGFQWTDFTQILSISVDFVQGYAKLSDAQRRACVIQILNDVIDITDTPYLPDSIFDPLFKFVVPSFVDYAMKLKK